MINCPICLHELPSQRLSKWEYHIRCRCGALFNVRFRRAWPLFPTWALRRTEPIRLPPPLRYLQYMGALKGLFAALRIKCRDHHRTLAASLYPVCDWLRFGDDHPSPIRAPEAREFLEAFKDPEAPHYAIWPDLGDFEEYHTNCDFASWCLERIGDGRFTDEDAEAFGYIFQHFPHVRGYLSKNDEVDQMWRRATQGQLPTSRRSQVRLRMSW